MSTSTTATKMKMIAAMSLTVERTDLRLIFVRNLNVCSSFGLTVVPPVRIRTIGNGAMFTPAGEPPAHAIARLVCLYRTRGLTIYEWPIHDITQGTVLRIINQNIPMMRAALAIARDTQKYMRTTISSAGAAAYIIMDSGKDPSIVHRFLAPAGDPLAPGDPRISLARIMRLFAAHPDDHPDWECLAYMLRTWNLYASKKNVNHVVWKPDDGMPRISTVGTGPR